MSEANVRPSARPGRALVILAILVVAVLVATVTIWRSRAGASGSRANGTVGTNSDQAWLVDEARAHGLEFRHVARMSEHFYFPEIMSGGVALLDFDLDGHLDVYFVQGGDLHPGAVNLPANVMFRNKGDGTFEDVTERSGVGDRSYGVGVAVGDYDNDRDPDIYVTNVGPNVLYRNNGDGTFTDVTQEAGVADSGWGSSAGFVDIDRDGYLDLFITNYITWSPESELECFSGTGLRDYCNPKNYAAPAADVLYRNRGDGSFEDISRDSGIATTFGNGLGVAFGDFNSDGYTDIYVANDGMPNQLWTNRKDLTFKNDAVLAGCAVNMSGASEAGMGVTSIDVDDDGDLDLFMTHLRNETNTFYLNQGGWFDDATASLALAGPSIPYTGFGVGFADFNLDGYFDVYVANGRVGIWSPSPDPDDLYAEPDQLYAGTAGPRFSEVKGIKVDRPGAGRAAALGDLDNDGDVDVVVVNTNAPAYALYNEVPKDGRTVMFRVLDTGGLDAEGATVSVTAGDRTWHRTVRRAYGYCASHDVRVHVGLGSADGGTVSVTWADGSRTPFGEFRAGRLYRLSRDGQSDVLAVFGATKSGAGVADPDVTGK